MLRTSGSYRGGDNERARASASVVLTVSVLLWPSARVGSAVSQPAGVSPGVTLIRVGHYPQGVALELK